MIRVVITSDWHADATTAGVRRYQDVAEAVNMVVGHCKTVKADVLIFCGDLTDPDTPRCWLAAALAIDAMVAASKAGIASLWIPGNHDVLEDGNGSHTLMPLQAACRLPGARGQVVDRPGVVPLLLPPDREGEDDRVLKVLALPFVPRSHSYDPAAEVENAAKTWGSLDLVVGHLNIEGIAPGSESSEFARGRSVFLPLAEIRRRFPTALVVNGHYHKAGTFEGVEIPGSVVKLTRGEVSNTVGFLEVEL